MNVSFTFYRVLSILYTTCVNKIYHIQIGYLFIFMFYNFIYVNIYKFIIINLRILKKNMQLHQLH